MLSHRAAGVGMTTVWVFLLISLFAALGGFAFWIWFGDPRDRWEDRVPGRLTLRYRRLRRR